MAAAIHNMDGVGGKPSWAWIFILEGLLTVLCAVVSYFILEDFPDTAKFLTETERVYKMLRVIAAVGSAFVFRCLGSPTSPVGLEV